MDAPMVSAWDRLLPLTFPAADGRGILQHRRRLAWFACAMPESFAVKFTPGEQVVGDEMNKHGACSLDNFAIAAAAARVSKHTVLLALKKAEARSSPSSTAAGLPTESARD